ncbi:sushi, von Willebrand factor type A, EGF and pentraxin domain-containing protein 1-like [Acanthaster planci]|uniref:Sushi, von Willebrand factor type A, EGF and pentraxin domain-containing protein 1-like n=1 Tax=Acanthaster planci TaxID=133434 RepID=A0A8B7YE49_ACAPL|nr:sushi, von Willebrand factor type A, EGF and pentraxin domain-containing protein 1-like [Acanthaster planci]
MRGSSVLYCNGRQWNGTLPTCTAAQPSNGYPASIRDGTHCGNSIPTVSNAYLRYANKKDAEGRLFYALVYSCHRGHTLRPANYAVYCSGGNVVGTLPNCLATCGHNNGGCRHTCRNGPDGAVCSCWDGYQPASSDGKTCRDINECLANNGRGPCQHICYNSPGSFSCYCHSGFTLAQDKTSCLRNQDQCKCGTHGRCVRNYGTRPTCVCYDGYRQSSDGLRCVDPEPPCDCGRGSTRCEEIDGVKRCTCARGYRASSDGTRCDDIDECLESEDGLADCQEACQNTLGSYSCYCPQQWLRLAADLRSCEERPCNCGLGSSSCSQPNGTKICTCADGYKLALNGASCIGRLVLNDVQTDSEMGLSNVISYLPVSKNMSLALGFAFLQEIVWLKKGTKKSFELPCSCGRGSTACSWPNGVKICTCADGYEPAPHGASCVDRNECQESAPCEGQCFNTQGSYYCRCTVSGYRLAANRHSCEDIDECQDSRLYNCQHTCVNIPGSYRCDCPPGNFLMPDGRSCQKCRPNSYRSATANECLECPANSQTSGRGAASISECRCVPGFSGDLSRDEVCKDIDECEQDNGGCKHHCSNTPGSFYCTCPDGFRLIDDGKTCEDHDECSQSNGGCQHTCSNTVGGFTCGCNEGYTVDPSDSYLCVDVNECEMGTHDCPQDCGNFPGGFHCRCNDNFILARDGKTCNPVTCSPIILAENMKVSPRELCLGNHATNIISVDTTCRFSCKNGYELQGGEARTCLNTGRWAGELASCHPVRCPGLQPPLNGLMSPPPCMQDGGIEFRGICAFSCNEGYTLEGSSFLTCRASGQWSGDKPTCQEVTEITCPRDMSVVLEQGTSHAVLDLPKPVHTLDLLEANVPIVGHRFPAGNTRVTYTARSNSSESSASCSFNVGVIDEEAPVFESCPKSFTVNTDEQYPTIEWETPVATDNVAVDSNTTWITPEGRFTWGTYTVLTEVRDAAGNSASCKFSISIQTIECGEPNGPLNGESDCSDWMFGKICEPRCNQSHYFFNGPPQDVYLCGFNGVWSPSAEVPDCSPYSYLGNRTTCPSGSELKSFEELQDPVCIACPRGMYSVVVDSTPSCLPCPTGTFQDGFGQLSCEPCPPGETTASEAAKSRLDCSQREEVTVKTTQAAITESKHTAQPAGPASDEGANYAKVVLHWLLKQEDCSSVKMQSLVVIFLSAISLILCPSIEAQVYPECPQTATDTEQNRQEIRETSRKFVQILERYQNKPAEIVFVLDSSGSVGEGDFGCEVQFVRHFSKLFSVSPETSRVAVVTYSSCDEIYTDLDYINSPVGKNKCTLLGTDLPNVFYRGGGTCTSDALRRAHDILAGSRPSADKIVFLLTDGMSNDAEDTLKAATELRNKATIFSLGLGTGVNVDELNGVATSPNSDHVFLLAHLTDIESLAEKVIGDHRDMASWDRDVPSDLCCSGSNCCDLRATCSCATQTGSYGCACHPGYTGEGKQNQCTACPRGTFKLQYGNQACASCPTLSTTAAEGSTSLDECECLPGHRGSPSSQVPCTPITCQQLSFAESSGVLLVPPNCGNLYGTECSMQCLPNYRPQPGTADQLTCLANGQWSDTPLQCSEITCGALSAPTNGHLSCDTTDWHIGTVCNVTCSEGYEQEVDLQRRCELNLVQQVGEWSDEVGTCKAKTCPALLSKQRMRVRPASCEKKAQEYTSECYYECIEGFRLEGVGLKTCQADETWSNSSVENKCIDVQPPEFTFCPVNVSVVTDRNKNFANVSWDQPTARDNAGEPRVEASAATSQERFYLGQTTVTYTARDDVGLVTNCTFIVTVEDREAPRVIYCPDNIEVESSERQTNVDWTVPTFKDNSGEPVKLTFNRPPGSYFSWGVAEPIWYRAEDGAGNRVFCNFTVSVRQYPCPYFPPPQNGALACETWLGGQFCRVACNENFDFNRKPATEYFCDNVAQWAPSPLSLDNPAEFKVPWPDCSEMRDPTAETTLGVQFYVSDCQLDDDDRTQIAADFVARFQELNDVIPGFCLPDSGCSVENVQVTCGIKNTTQEGGRRRRQANDAVLQIEFTVVVDTSQQQPLNESSAADQSGSSIQALGDIVEAMDTAVSTGLLELPTEDGNVLSPVGPVGILRPVTLSCHDGEVLRNQSCVVCPTGTYHDVQGGVCQDCRVGSYQNKEGQMTCLQCLSGSTTRRPASKYPEDCKARCPKGTFSSSGLVSCMACPQGTYQPRAGTTSCKPCPHGLTTWTEGAISEDECSGECPMGSYSGTGYTPCSPCPKGTYQELIAQTACVPCPEGLYTHHEGAHALGYCQEINECESQPCMHGALCTDLPRGYRCVCPPGFTGPNCQLNINDCNHDLCLNNATCVDQVAGYRCECTTGYEGEHCQIDVDECQSNPCSNNAVCFDGPNSYSCECAPGFTGEFCEVNFFDCASDPCQNDGTCVDLAQNYTCCCKPGYRGRHCEILVDHCLSDPCLNGGTCEASFNSMTCLCLPGYAGERCEQELNECELQNVVCQHGGKCIDIVNGFRCSCTPRYSGEYCETALSGDFDLLFPTASTSDYVMLQGTMPGLNALTLAFWMRTTDTANAGTPLSYATREADGTVQDNAFTVTDYNSLAFIINGEFTYTDEKLNIDSNWRHVAITWASLDGRWAFYVDGTVRRSGYDFKTGSFIRGSGVLVLGQEQDSYGGSFTQTQAFVGDLSQMNMWDYAMTPDEITTVYSSCAVSGNVLGWSQVASSIHGDVSLVRSSQLCPKINNCQPSTCLNGATCTDLIGSYQCHCAIGYQGTSCELLSTSCTPQTCLNGGSCHSNGSLLFCMCAPGYSGERCEQQDLCPSSATCLNGGVCVNDGSIPKCNCAPGFTGRVCEYDINECASDNGGCTHDCLNTLGSFYCSCSSGFALQPDGRSCFDASYCTHEGRFHLANDVWDFKCSTCRCVQGVPVCQIKMCPALKCSKDEYEYKAPGACCPQCLPASKNCTITRDGGHITYDFNRYEHHGNCRYVLSQDCTGSQFSVEVQYEATKKKIKKWAVWLRLDCVEVEIAYDGSVKVTGVPVELPYLHAEPMNVMIAQTNSSGVDGIAGSSIEIQTDRGVIVSWSQLGAIQVTAPGTYAGQLCGLCGNMNGNRKDDRTTRQFLPARSAREFTHSWKVDGYRYCTVPKVRSKSRLAFGAISTDRLAACAGLNFNFLRDIRKKCSIFRRRSFQICHPVVSPTRYFEWCMQDSCSCSSNEPCHCEAITAYMYECQRNNVPIQWTSNNACSIRCPEGMIYDHCGPACLPTCEDPEPRGPACQTSSCTPRCQCPAGTVLHQDSCILPRYCPALSKEH